ncbi:MAG TPA: OadG family protein [Bacillota bacterium]|nr:OadG family protein [Bacillota bacterium]
MNILEILESGTKIMIIGLATVFIALSGIVLTVTLISKAVNYERPNKGKAKTDIKENSNLEIKVAEETSKIETQAEDEELIALITAAVAASLNRSTHNVIVKSVNRITGTGSQWSKAGRYEYISSKL